MPDEKMPTETLEALKGSIAKWEAIVAGAAGDRGERNCPLCAMFIDGDCLGCPVAEKASDTSCFNTPYDQWRRSDRVRSDEGYRVGGTSSRAAAKAELKFLRSLLPEGERR